MFYIYMIDRSTTPREKSASSTRSYYKNYEHKQRLMNSSDSFSNSADKDAASASNAARGLRSAARLSSAYRFSDPLASESYYVRHFYVGH